MKHNDLGFLGDDTQLAIVKQLITNRSFFYDVEGYIDPEAFTVPSLGQLVKMVMSRYRDTERVPTMKELEIIARDTVYDKGDRRMLSMVMTRIDEIDLEEFGTAVVDKAIKFFMGQRLEKVLKNAKDSLNRTGFNEDLQARVIEQIQSIGYIESAGKPVAVTEDVIMDSLSLKSDNMVPTGLGPVDMAMNGGLAKGNTGMVIARTGGGKTTLGSIICCNALTRGYKVVHIFFEDRQAEILHKYYAHLTGIDTKDFKDLTDAEKKDITRRIYESEPDAKSMFRNNLRLMPMTAAVTQVEDIIRQLTHMEKVEGWKPDMVYIDYLSCIQPSSNRQNLYDNEYIALEQAMKKFDAYAKKNDIAIWVAQQTNREAFNPENLTSPGERMKTVQGSLRIIQPVTRVLFLCSAGEENRVNLYLDKARNAQLGEWENIYFNYATCQIEVENTHDTFDIDNKEYEY